MMVKNNVIFKLCAMSLQCLFGVGIYSDRMMMLGEPNGFTK